MKWLDLPTLEHLTKCITAREAIEGPRVGDYLLYADYSMARLAHHWGDSVQPSSNGTGGSYHLTATGVVSYSGGLEPSIAIGRLTKHYMGDYGIMAGPMWVCFRGILEAHCSVTVPVPCRVYLVQGAV